MLTFEERLARSTERQANGCLIFLGAKSPKGYGFISYQGKSWQTHRASYTHFVGPIPPGLHLDHLCRRPSCCEPSHLEPVTPLENRHRQIDFVRTTCAKGHPYEGARGAHGERRCSVCRRASARRKYWERRGQGMSGREATVGRFL